MNSKKFTGLDVDGMPLKDQWKLESELRKYKYQIKIQLSNGRIRFIHANEKEAAERYVGISKSKIIWIKEL